MNIRNATANDLKSVQMLSHELFQSDSEYDNLLDNDWPYEEGLLYFIDRIKNQKCVCLVAEVEEKVVGFLTGSLTESEPWRPIKRTELEMIYVREEYRNSAIGTKLVRQFLEWSKYRGAKACFLTAYINNRGATEFYNKIGFTCYECKWEIKL